VEPCLECFGRPLELAEEPSGSYLGENDLVRFEDVYVRELCAELPWWRARLFAGTKPAGPDHEADEGVESPDNMQMPMTITPMQAPSDIPKTNISIAASPCGCRSARLKDGFSGSGDDAGSYHVTVYDDGVRCAAAHRWSRLAEPLLQV